jgi:ABC-2 type transport system permease protein
MSSAPESAVPPPAAGARPGAAPDGVRAGAAHGSTAPRMRGRAWGPLRREWIKLLFQRRTYLIWGGAAVIPFLISLAIHFSRDQGGGGGGGPAFLDKVLGNGMYVPLASLAVLIPFMLPLAAAMVGGYMIAGEAELGTLRIILLRPVRRGSMLLTKWAAAMLYLAFGAVILFASGLLFGWLFFGLHPMVTLSGSTVSIAHGLGLTLLVYLFGLAAMSTMVSLALLCSVVTDSSLTALIVTVVIYIAINIVIAFSYFAWLRPWVFPSYYTEFLNFFRDPIYWRPVVKGIENFAAWSVGLTVAAYFLFRRKDVLS